MPDRPSMLTPGEVARLVGVNAKTVSRWCTEGRLDSVRTPGGHRRITRDAMVAFLGRMGIEEQAARDLLA